MWVIANWKMNGSKVLLSDWSSALLVPDDGIELAVLLPYHLLDAAQELCPIDYGAQNVFPKDSGAVTGEISGPMLVELGCEFVLVGHSERRQLLGELDEFVAEKCRYILQQQQCPILCVGETLEVRQAGEADAFVSQQLESCLNYLPETNQRLIIAYEPIWAIGTGEVPTSADIEAMHRSIRLQLTQAGFTDVPILYGGSVNASNASTLAAIPGVDGFLVGGASLKINELNEVIRKCRE